MDPILYWNEVALEANRISHTNGKGEQNGPTLSSRALAIVHLAMYDAYAKTRNPKIVDKKDKLPPYDSTLPSPEPDSSPDAAVAAAAHDTLSKLYPSQKPFFALKHLEAGLRGSGLDKGHQFGTLVAQRILADRKGDPDASDDGYASSVDRGDHRVDPDNPNQGFHAPFYGALSRGFAITKRHVLKKPPAVDSGDYVKALKQVLGKGIAPELMGTLLNFHLPEASKYVYPRTSEQTLIGIYWAYDGAAGLGTPPRLYNQIIHAISEKAELTTDQNARLFALVNAAMGDAGILAWDQKYIHDLWRPVVGIREHDKSLGPAADEGIRGIDKYADPGWLPLGAPATNSMNPVTNPTNPHYPCNQAIVVKMKNFTPNFPAYPSGHATFGAAAFRITRLYLEQLKKSNVDQHLVFISEEFNGINQDNLGRLRPRHVRKFDRGLCDMIIENGRSRVYLGVHWIFDAFAPESYDDPESKPDDSINIGGVPLGIRIAEDIFNNGEGLKKSKVGARTDKDIKWEEEEEEKRKSPRTPEKRGKYKS